MPNGMPWMDGAKEAWLAGRVPALVDFNNHTYDGPDAQLGVKPGEANLVTSLMPEALVLDDLIDSEIAEAFEGETWHRPVLDLDFPARLVESTTPGHFHLYLDTAITWTAYTALLQALADAGIVEGGYANASIDRGFTGVRPPWVKKEKRPIPAGTFA